ncbi:hypothetical protein CRUP_000715 [Coryphaenoides rupestris]|nr:hypothetical protein CRUP_000715 [Coryphaenoides rupestris]
MFKVKRITSLGPLRPLGSQTVSISLRDPRLIPGGSEVWRLGGSDRPWLSRRSRRRSGGPDPPTAPRRHADLWPPRPAIAESRPPTGQDRDRTGTALEPGEAKAQTTSRRAGVRDRRRAAGDVEMRKITQL